MTFKKCEVLGNGLILTRGYKGVILPQWLRSTTGGSLICHLWLFWAWFPNMAPSSCSGKWRRLTFSFQTALFIVTFLAFGERGRWIFWLNTLWGCCKVHWDNVSEGFLDIPKGYIIPKYYSCECHRQRSFSPYSLCGSCICCHNVNSRPVDNVDFFGTVWIHAAYAPSGTGGFMLTLPCF